MKKEQRNGMSIFEYNQNWNAGRGSLQGESLPSPAKGGVSKDGLANKQAVKACLRVTYRLEET